MTAASTMEGASGSKDDANPLLEFKHKNHSLNINASNVAACVGYHEFQSLPELMLRHVYQGGQALLEHDAKLLGLQLVIDTESELLQLAESSGSLQVLQSVQRALQIKNSAATLPSIQEATKLKQSIAKHADATKLTPHQLKVLQEGTREAIDTGCGHSWEEQALDQYERQCGWDVRERNATCKVWDFESTTIDNDIPTLRPLGPARAKPRRKHTETMGSENDKSQTNNQHRYDSRGVKRKRPSSYDSQISERALQDFSKQEDTHSNSSNNDGSIDGNGNNTDRIDILAIEEGSSKNGTENTVISLENDENDTHQTQIRQEQNQLALQQNEKSRPFVTIKGMVDGIRDELGPTTVVSSGKANNNGQEDGDDDDDLSCDSLSLSRVVVECKHRMNKLLNGPRFSECIQAVVYCFMYEVDDADIVQVLRSNNNETKPKLLTDYFEPVGANNDKKTDVTQNDSNNKNDQSNDGTKNEQDTTNAKPKKEEVGANENSRAPEESTTPNDKNNPTETNVTMTIAVDRVSLDDSNFGHRANWKTIILPKLRQWVDAVYGIRESDDKRYRLLTSLSAMEASDLEETRKRHAKAAWELIFDECSFLREGLSGERFRRETQ